MKDCHIKWNFTFMNAATSKFETIEGEDKSESLAIRSLWSLCKLHGLKSIRASFYTQEGKQVEVSTISGKVKRS